MQQGKLRFHCLIRWEAFQLFRYQHSRFFIRHRSDLWLFTDDPKRQVSVINVNLKFILFSLFIIIHI